MWRALAVTVGALLLLAGITAVLADQITWRRARRLKRAAEVARLTNENPQCPS